MSECSCHILKGYPRLREGMYVQVFLEQDDGTHKFECDAILIRKLDSWYTPEPFPIVDGCPKCRATINNIKEKWVVEFVSDDVFITGKQATRYIHKFHSYGVPHIRDEYDDEEE